MTRIKERVPLGKILTGLGVLLGFIAIYQNIDPSISLAYDFHSSELIPDEQNISSTEVNLAISANGKLLSNPFYARVSFLNDGEVEFLSEQFIEPLKIHVGNESEIAYAKVVDQEPKNQDISIHKFSKYVEVRPSLVNPGDKFSIFLVTNGIPELSINSRIAGLSNLKKVSMFNTSDIGILVPMIFIIFSIAAIVAHRMSFNVEESDDYLLSTKWLLIESLPMFVFVVSCGMLSLALNWTGDEDFATNTGMLIGFVIFAAYYLSAVYQYVSTRRKKTKNEISKLLK